MGPLIVLQEVWKFVSNPATLFEVFWATQLGIIVGMLPEGSSQPRVREASAQVDAAPEH